MLTGQGGAPGGWVRVYNVCSHEKHSLFHRPGPEQHAQAASTKHTFDMRASAEKLSGQVARLRLGLGPESESSARHVSSESLRHMKRLAVLGTRFFQKSWILSAAGRYPAQCPERSSKALRLGLCLEIQPAAKRRHCLKCGWAQAAGILPMPQRIQYPNPYVLQQLKPCPLQLYIRKLKPQYRGLMYSVDQRR